MEQTVRDALGTSHRVTTINSNGDLPESREVAPEKLPAAEAVRRAIEQLGEVVIDDTLAPQQMRELADRYIEYARRKAEFDAKADAAKTAKKGLDTATELLLETFRSFAFPKPLPLFDTKQAEDDADKMLDAANRPEPMFDEDGNETHTAEA